MNPLHRNVTKTHISTPTADRRTRHDRNQRRAQSSLERPVIRSMCLVWRRKSSRVVHCARDDGASGDVLEASGVERVSRDGGGITDVLGGLDGGDSG